MYNKNKYFQNSGTPVPPDRSDCIYDCEYCYLKGMYPSANIVIFVNIEDIFEELHRMLSEHPVYLCVSYDTDLLAFEAMTGYVREWEHFVLIRNLSICSVSSFP